MKTLNVSRHHLNRIKMIVVWSGRGFLSALVLFISIAFSAKLFPTSDSNYAFVLGFFVAAVFSWFFGKKWNEEKVSRDEETNQDYLIKPNHSLFFIRMQYWGIVFFVLGFVFLAKELI